LELLTELSIRDYTAKLASKEPAPGGGSAAALSGVLAASLMEMVLNLTLGREEFAQYEKQLSEKQIILTGLHRSLDELVDRDAAAFNSVMAAFKLPKGTEEEKTARSAAIQTGYKEAAEIPMETARACLEVLEVGKTLLGKINAHAVSDLVVGALAAHTGVVGALLNTTINLPSIKDEFYVTALKGQVHQLKVTADELVADIQKIVYEDPAFEDLR
jgi:formiminotetrahydrofolate cyclodeaminase